MMNDIEYLVESMEKLKINLTQIQQDQFYRYYKMLIKQNEVMNLTSITEYKDVVVKHFVDSLSIVKAYHFSETTKVIDIGTGAGFPGVPIKIVFPEVEITLLDSLNKRISFLNEVIKELDLKKITAIHGRAEDYAKPSSLREKYDLCVSRAVANLSTLSEYCLPFVKTGGTFISYKSNKIEDEIKASEKAIKILGGNIKTQVEFILPGSDIDRNLILIEKIKATPKQFPRKAGLASKEPIREM